jgi:hypothetical protein
MTVKGLGLLPKPASLQHYTDIFESVIAEARSKPWGESLKTRVEVLLRLYSDSENFDPTILGGLEIFNGKAFENLRGNPFASLLYVGMNHTADGMKYVSFQVNSRVIILEKGDPYYRFLLASRKLFEFEKFHLYQPDYPFGYLLSLRGPGNLVRSNTLYPLNALSHQNMFSRDVSYRDDISCNCHSGERQLSRDIPRRIHN